MIVATQFATRDEATKAHTLEVLARLGGNRTHTARALDITVRTLQRDLERWHVQDRQPGETWPRQ